MSGNTEIQRSASSNSDGVITVIEPVPVSAPDLSDYVTHEALSAAVASLTGQIVAVQGDIPRVSYRYSQDTPAPVWTVAHNLGRYPGGIVAQDSTGDVIECDVGYVDLNTLQLIHAMPISGIADIS